MRPRRDILLYGCVTANHADQLGHFLFPLASRLHVLVLSYRGHTIKALPSRGHFNLQGEGLNLLYRGHINPFKQREY